MIIVKADKSGISSAVARLKKGQVVAYPTDTAYGLGGIFNSVKVTKDILRIKNRQDEKFTIVASSLYQVKKFFRLNQIEIELAKKFWPGPLSIVVSSRFAVRVPNSKIAIALCRRVGRPLIATSANISGQQSPYSAQEIIDQFTDKKNQPALILDAGRLKKIKTSTLVQVRADKIEVLRQGAVKI